VGLYKYKLKLSYNTIDVVMYNVKNCPVSIELNYLAHWANLLTGCIILRALISFSFFNHLLETNYLRIHWTDFHGFSPHDSYLFVDDRSEPFFRLLKGSCHTNQFSAKFSN